MKNIELYVYCEDRCEKYKAEGMPRLPTDNDVRTFLKKQFSGNYEDIEKIELLSDGKKYEIPTEEKLKCKECGNGKEFVIYRTHICYIDEYGNGGLSSDGGKDGPYCEKCGAYVGW